MSELHGFALLAMLIIGWFIVGFMIELGHTKVAWVVGILFCGPAIINIWLRVMYG